MPVKNTSNELIDNGVEQAKGNPMLAKNVWYFVQATDAPVGSKAILPATVTSGSITLGGDSIDEQTKSGRVLMASTHEDSVELEMYFVPGDKTLDIIKSAKSNGKQVKVWRVEVDERVATPEGDKKAYPAMFGYSTVDELSIEDGDDLVTASFTLNILDKFKEGTFPLSDDQVNALKDMYNFERPGETTGDMGSVD